MQDLKRSGRPWSARWGIMGLAVLIGAGAVATAAPDVVVLQGVSAADDDIDFDKARALFQRRQRGEELTKEEKEYIERAMAARRKAEGPRTGAPGVRRRVDIAPRETIGLKPLNEATGDDRYDEGKSDERGVSRKPSWTRGSTGEDGGLYGAGQNEPPAAHRRAAEVELARIRPLDADGRPDENGQVVFVSISMSNATQEFSRFKRLADADPAKASRVTIVDCAQGGQAMAEWVSPTAEPWIVADRRLIAAGASPRQVQVAWIKLANKGPSGALTEHGRKLQRDTLAVIHNAKVRFPNLRIAYLSSRIYAGYATSGLNPEPYAYESAFAVRWLIQDQISARSELNYAPERGEVRAPLLLWGPYLWADGTTPRKLDGLRYQREDLAGDGTHPSETGRDKVARVMLDFYKHDPLAKPWFGGKSR